eukprot:4990489-Pyramimonas_sp.AAC.1
MKSRPQTPLPRRAIQADAPRSIYDPPRGYLDPERHATARAGGLWQTIHRTPRPLRGQCEPP